MSFVQRGLNSREMSLKPGLDLAMSGATANPQHLHDQALRHKTRDVDPVYLGRNAIGFAGHVDAVNFHLTGTSQP